MAVGVELGNSELVVGDDSAEMYWKVQRKGWECDDVINLNTDLINVLLDLWRR